MPIMTKDEKLAKLRKYLIEANRLWRKCDDAARWSSMSFGPAGSAASPRSSAPQPDSVKETAIQLRQECEQLAVTVRDLRQELDSALSQMPDDVLRDLLEMRYVSGVSRRDLRDKTGYSERHLRRLMTQALQELDRCSAFFS